jgi:hypothetical protein
MTERANTLAAGSVRARLTDATSLRRKTNELHALAAVLSGVFWLVLTVADKV